MNLSFDRAVIGPATSIPDPSNPLGGSEPDAVGVYICSDTGDIKVSTGQAWKTIGTLGGGGASYPGVTVDNGTPPGIIVAGEVNAQGLLTAAGGIFGPILKTLAGGGIRIDKTTDDNYALEIHLSPASSGDEIVLMDSSASVIARVAVDGAIGTIGPVALWGHAAPVAQPVLATGAGRTVDDVITLLQSYGICKQS